MRKITVILPIQDKLRISKMNIITIDNGILCNKIRISLESEDKFKGLMGCLEGVEFNVKEYNGYITYSFDCEFFSSRFLFSQTFFNSKKYGKPLLNWQDGSCAKLKWKSSKLDLIDDLEDVGNILINHGVTLIKAKSEYQKIYKMNGLVFSVIGAIQDMSVVIEFNI